MIDGIFPLFLILVCAEMHHPSSDKYRKRKNMNKITSEVKISRRQLLLTFATVAAGLVSSAVFAKLQSVGSAASMAEQVQHKISEKNLTNIS
jgi:hypothetical protein